MTVEERVGIAAVAAFDARRAHGENSHEYRRALRGLEMEQMRRSNPPVVRACSKCGGLDHNRRTCEVP